MTFRRRCPVDPAELTAWWFGDQESAVPGAPDPVAHLETCVRCATVIAELEPFARIRHHIAGCARHPLGGGASRAQLLADIRAAIDAEPALTAADVDVGSVVDLLAGSREGGSPSAPFEGSEGPDGEGHGDGEDPHPRS